MISTRQKYPLAWATVLLISVKYAHATGFDTVSMTKPSMTILPEEIKRIVTSHHVAHCIHRCKELTIPSGCNMIKFIESTSTCMLAYRDIVQNICPPPPEEPASSPERKKRSVAGENQEEILSLSGQFILTSLVPTGTYNKSYYRVVRNRIVQHISIFGAS